MSGRDASRPPNRLIRSASPYLRLHAHNPVDWYPWGDEAVEAARSRGVPILLSIGYATCYWCHVMERESFSDEGVARLMNENFVCVKVDREERPDIDDIYMTATQVMTGHGGWPMTVFIEPGELRPFWCGTYFPPEPRHNMPSFPQVLGGLARAWREQHAEVMQQAESLAGAVRQYLDASGGGDADERSARRTGADAELGDHTVERAVSDLMRQYDRTHGGFGGAPKFPQTPVLELVMELAERTQDGPTKAACEGALRHTLERMAVGGLHDQVGGGFHRYCVDATWTVPHFEKMLYDNAQLALLYLRAGGRFNDSYFDGVSRRTLDYMIDEMQDEAGGFHSAQDAEVDGREGLSYLWTAGEVREVLGESDADFALRVFQMDLGPNFRDPHHPDDIARSVPRMSDRPGGVARTLGLGEGEFAERLARVRDALMRARRLRKQPLKDDKVIASWNAMAIRAVALGHARFGGNKYIEAATRAGVFLRDRLTVEGRLMRCARDGAGSVPGYLEDYGGATSAYVALARIANDQSWLREAERLAANSDELFGTPDGAWADVQAGHSNLFLRPRSLYDSATPSGTATMLHALIDLADGTGDDAYASRAAKALAAISARVATQPASSTESLGAYMRLRGELARTARQPSAATPAGAPRGPRASTFTPVEVLADRDRVEIRDGVGELLLRLRIHPDYHIVAGGTSGDAGPQSLVVHELSPSGLVVYADYPTGEPWSRDRSVHVIRGEVEMRVVIESKEPSRDRERRLLGVTYQVCTDTECLAHVTVELDVAIDDAGPTA